VCKPIIFDCNELLKYPEEREGRAEVRLVRQNAVARLLSGQEAFEHAEIFRRVDKAMFASTPEGDDHAESD